MNKILFLLINLMVLSICYGQTDTEKSVGVQYDKAVKLVEEKHYEEGIKMLSNLLDSEKKDENKLRGHYYLAHSYYSLEDYDSALKEYEKIVNYLDLVSSSDVESVIYERLAGLYNYEARKITDKKKHLHKIYHLLTKTEYWGNKYLEMQPDKNSTKEWMSSVNSYLNQFRLDSGEMVKLATQAYAQKAAYSSDFVKDLLNIKGWEREHLRSLRIEIIKFKLKGAVSSNGNLLKTCSIQSNNFEEIRKFVSETKSKFLSEELQVMCQRQFVAVNNGVKPQGGFVRSGQLISEEERIKKLNKIINSAGVNIKIDNLIHINIPYTDFQFSHNGEIIESTYVHDNMMVQKSNYLPFNYQCKNIDIAQIKEIADFIKSSFPIANDMEIVDYDRIFKGNYNSKDQLVTAEVYIGGHTFDGFKHLVVKAIENLNTTPNVNTVKTSECQKNTRIYIDVKNEIEDESKFSITGGRSGINIKNNAGLLGGKYTTDDEIFLNHYECVGGAYNFSYTYNIGSSSETTVSGSFDIDGYCNSYKILVDGKRYKIECDY